MSISLWLVFLVSRNYEKEMPKNKIYEIKLNETILRIRLFSQHLKALNRGNCVFQSDFEEFFLLN